LPENLMKKIYELFNDKLPNENEFLTSFLLLLLVKFTEIYF